MKNHGNMVSQKQNHKSPATEIGHRILHSDREFKIVVMEKFNKLQENSKRQFNELRNKIN